MLYAFFCFAKELRVKFTSGVFMGIIQSHKSIWTGDRGPMALVDVNGVHQYIKGREVTLSQLFNADCTGSTVKQVMCGFGGEDLRAAAVFTVKCCKYGVEVDAVFVNVGNGCFVKIVVSGQNIKGSHVPAVSFTLGACGEVH